MCLCHVSETYPIVSPFLSMESPLRRAAREFAVERP